MTNIFDEQHGSPQFDITDDDLNRIADRLEHDSAAQELNELALGIIRGRMEHGDDPATLAEDILGNSGEHIRNRLSNALQSDSRFTELEGKWFLAEKLPHIEPGSLQKFHRLLLQNPSASEDEMLAVIKEKLSADPILVRMALQAALSRSPERFENIGTPVHPQWKARLPDVEQAAVTHYAYDPETYEVLCRPGQRLSPKKAERLQELKLYAHVVTFAE